VRGRSDVVVIAVSKGILQLEFFLMHLHTYDRDGLENHSHDHSHSHGHGHMHGLTGNMTGLLGAAVAVTFVLVGVEITAGYFGHSIALVSDAIHNLTDIPTLIISWIGMRMALKPPTAQKTFGYHRAAILAAFVNAMLLELVAIFLLYESVSRLRSPVEVRTALMLWVSVVALAINGGITLAVHRGRRDLNVRAVWLHNLGDALSNVAIFVGALAIRWTGAQWVDPCVSIGIGAMVLWSATGILNDSGHILLEGLPREIRLQDVAGAMLKVPGVQEVHDVHIWTLGTDMVALSCHVRIPDMHMEDSEKILDSIREALEHNFRIAHTTIQFERAGLPAKAGPYMPHPAPRPQESTRGSRS
jgi:cobalt-zinc-cadmium efflux system protein